MTSQLIDKFIEEVPEGFVRDYDEGMDAAFARAFKDVQNGGFQEPEALHMRGYLRHARCEEQFRLAATTNGLWNRAPHTFPKGGRYSVARSGSFVIGRAAITLGSSVPRPTKYRKQMASLNKWLKPLQLDLLEAFTPPPADAICALAITIAGKNGHDPRVPAWVGFGIPTPDLGSWMMLKPVGELLAAYHPTVDQPVPDMAFVKVRKSVREGEGEKGE